MIFKTFHFFINLFKIPAILYVFSIFLKFELNFIFPFLILYYFLLLLLQKFLYFMLMFKAYEFQLKAIGILVMNFRLIFYNH